MSTLPRSRARLITAALALAALGLARADADRVPMPRNAPPAYAQECGACHLAYAPGLLPAPSWQRLMGGLERHFGTDASLDVATLQPIARWLQAHAGADRRVRDAPPQDRITRSAWFERKHREIVPAVWRHPGVVSAAQCGTCHRGADRGDFDDDGLRVPAGLDPRLLRAWRE